MLCVAPNGSGVTLTRLGTVMHSPYQQAARRIVETAAQKADQTASQRRCPETVEPVHHSAVAGNELARILGSVFAFDPGLEEVAELRQSRQQQRHKGERH